MTDSVLVTRFLDGDIQAFNLLVMRWERPLYNFIWRQTGDEETAKDITQMAFIRIYKQLKRLKDPDKFSSWAYRIANNLCFDEFRSRKRKKTQALDTMTDIQLNKAAHQHHSHLPAPDLMAHRNHVGELLKDSLQKLPAEQRVVIVMKQYQELKFTEIAEILNESVNTVKSRLYYGLKAMRKHLEDADLHKEVLLHEMS
ncbi:sigma-70 family RNA polymerase sigma factor [bacterium]|nr:sigma-70 family RNA polymerase sigma factor [bacterium]